MDTPQDTLQYVPEIKRHITYFLYCLKLLPQPYTSAETTRMTLGSFAIGGLDQLNALASNVNEERRAGLINWIYAQQVPPQDGPEPFLYCGFRGGPFSGDNSFYNRANIAATFSALVTLLTLGDDLSRVNRQAIIQGLKHLQQEDGRFIPTVGTLESDMRFVYCAAAISFILNDWSGVDREKALDFIWKSQNYDGGFAPGPGQESHGGTTYCAIAALYLMGELNLNDPRLRRTKRWSILRLSSGFQGRVNKPVDTCYSFWLGSSLKLLDVFDLADHQENRAYIISTQSHIGGFAKWVDNYPDLLHSYLGLLGLGMASQDEHITKLGCALAATHRAVEQLGKIRSLPCT